MAVKASIWRDTYYTTTASSLSYSVSVDGETIFSGKAWRMPNEENLKININKICENYLFQDIDEILGGATGQTNSNASRLFTLKNGAGTTLETYRFIDDWSYDHNWTGATEVLSDPICDEYATGMMVLKTKVSTAGTITTSATTPTKVVGCCPAALYYTDAKGGWCAFAIRGTAIRKDNITSYTTDRAYNNTTKEFEKMRNINETKTTWTLSTHYLSDEQAANLAKNLIPSNMVYLHNLKDGTIKPVVITDNNVVFQTYQTNGRKLCQYKINVEESHLKRRRH